jgi:ADP-ribosylglycohydrolase
LQENKALSSLIGGALGDALGYSREFVGHEALLDDLRDRNWWNADLYNGPWEMTTRDGDALISDDTQMTIATGRALLATDKEADDYYGDFAKNLSEAYITWSKHPDNNRAPGGTCMRACAKLDQGFPWYDATDIHSMGCGANMRVAPIALMSEVGLLIQRDLAALSAAVTHGHPAAVVAAMLTVETIVATQEGMTGREILEEAVKLCTTHRLPYPKVLGDLWVQSEYGSAAAYMEAGYMECVKWLFKAAAAIELGWKGQCDPCDITGQAWTAPEALAGALLCVAGLWDNPVEVIQRAAVSNGDSDSIAAIAGNIRGAAGVEWPKNWVHSLESGPVRELRHLALSL